MIFLRGSASDPRSFRARARARNFELELSPLFPSPIPSLRCVARRRQMRRARTAKSSFAAQLYLGSATFKELGPLAPPQPLWAGSSPPPLLRMVKLVAGAVDSSLEEEPPSSSKFIRVRVRFVCVSRKTAACPRSSGAKKRKTRLSFSCREIRSLGMHSCPAGGRGGENASHLLNEEFSNSRVLDLYIHFSLHLSLHLRGCVEIDR